MGATVELRSMAVSVGLDMPQAATLMMGAADAIDHLEAENAKLRELVAAYDSALMRMCDQTQGLYSKSDSYPCDECVLGKGHGFDRCGINELQEEAHELGIEVD